MTAKRFPPKGNRSQKGVRLAQTNKHTYTHTHQHASEQQGKINGKPSEAGKNHIIGYELVESSEKGVHRENKRFHGLAPTDTIRIK